MVPCQSHLTFYCVALMMSSMFVIQITTATGDLPCPSACKCRKDRSVDLLSEVNRITCTALGLTSIPDLSPLKDSTLSNYLYLDLNQIKEISKKDFPPGLKIVVLNLSSNMGVKISTDAFLNLGYSLKNLTLDAVDLVFDKTLDIFDGLFSLEGLSLQNNNKHPYTHGAVQNVEATLFQGEVAKNLKSLSLGFCTIRSMRDNTLKGLTNLVELDLSNNWLTSIPSTIKHLSNLKFVEFHYCRIESLKDDDFAGLHLEEIDLSTNAQLTTIGDRAFSGSENSLKMLNLQRCKLTDIPTEALRGMKKLTVLDLSENRFADVGSSPLEGDYKLTELIISSPGLKFNPEMFKGQEESIKELSIPNMNLESIPREALETLTNLDILFLEYNNITTLPEAAFDGLTVQYIRLDYNPLSTIAKGAFNGLPPKLTISLTNTKVSDIDFLVGYNESAIESVKLRYTSLVCKCSMKESLSVLDTIKHVTGDCTMGNEEVAITSNKLEPVLEQACEEERKRNSANTIQTTVNLVVVSLVFIISLLN